MAAPRNLAALAGLGLLLGSGVLATAGTSQLAQAAAVLVPPDRAPHRRPTVALERILVMHDGTAGRERLVIETSLRDAATRLGWLVPVPARPEVAIETRSVFPALARALPVDVWSDDRFMLGTGAPRPIDEGLVDVTPRANGRLTARVIEASDVDGLDRWRSEVGLGESEPERRWREGYAARGYWLVALRFDPPTRTPAGPPAQTAVRLPPVAIDFDVALPFLPWSEPDHPRPVMEQERRTEVWLVAGVLGNPIALDTSGDARRFVRPIDPQQRWKDGRDAVLQALGEGTDPPLPAGPLTVQTFLDDHRRRDGLGDVVFGAFQFQADFVAPTGARLEALRPVLWALDPSLATEGEGAP